VYCPIVVQYAIVLHQGGQCRWAGGMKGWLIRAQQPQSKTIYCEGQAAGGGRGIREDASSIVAAGVTANTMEGNSRAFRESREATL